MNGRRLFLFCTGQIAFLHTTIWGCRIAREIQIVQDSIFCENGTVDAGLLPAGGGARNAPGGGAPNVPPEEKTWLQKNWMLVLPLFFIVRSEPPLVLHNICINVPG